MRGLGPGAWLEATECETAVLSSDMCEYVDPSDSVRGAAGGRARTEGRREKYELNPLLLAPDFASG